MRDYLAIEQNISIPPRILFEDNWFEKGLDYFAPEIVKDWGGEEISIEEIQKNDVLTFSVQSKVANHCGVYLGNDVFLSSCRK